MIPFIGISRCFVRPLILEIIHEFIISNNTLFAVQITIRAGMRKTDEG